jgi:hypothetical protein
MKETKRFAFLLSIILIIGMMGYGGCGSGGGGGGGGDTPVEPGIVDVDTWPELPIPTSPQNLPSKTETVTYIAPLKADLTPTVIAAKGDWVLLSWDCKSFGSCYENCVAQPEDESLDVWSDDDPSLLVCDNTPGGESITLMEEGVILAEPHYEKVREYHHERTELCLEWDGGMFDWCTFTNAAWFGNLKPLTNIPHLRRDRHCQVEGVPEIQDGPVTLDVSITHSYGVETTSAESFAKSVSFEASAGNAFYNLELVIKYSYSRDYSKTIYQYETETETKGYTIPAGETWVFLSWTCVDEYSISDSDGNPYTDPNYEFEDFGSVVISGTATHEKIHQFKK